MERVIFGVATGVVAVAAWYRRANRKQEAAAEDDASGAEVTASPAAGTAFVTSVNASATKRTTKLQSACVFCGSRAPPGEFGERVEREARSLAQLMVDNNVDLVYGGGSVGIMGMIARGVDSAGGKVTGIIPKALEPKEASGQPIQPENVIVTTTMHQRKQLMAKNSDVFIALPGGFGTWEEVMEMITWTQLGIQRKTVALLNVDGFYDKLIEFIYHGVKHNFISRERFEGIVVHARTAEELFAKVKTHLPPKGYLDWDLESA